MDHPTRTEHGGPPRASAAEHERWRLATEVRDGLGQLVALTSIRLGALRGAPAARREVLLRDLEDLCRTLQERCDVLSFELSPIVLFDLGLRPGVEALAEDLARRHGLRVRVRGDDPSGLDPDVAIALFRALQDLLANLSRHGDGEAILHILDAGPSVRIEISCPGGPGPDEPDPSLRRGIRDLGGTLSIARRTEPRVVIELPRRPACGAPTPS